MIVRFSKIAFLGVFLAIPISDGVQSQPVCDQLNVQKNENDYRKNRFIGNYPGTALGFLGCAATAASQRESDQAGAFMVCAATLCLVVGFDTCTGAAGEAIAIAAEQDRVQTGLCKYSCGNAPSNCGSRR